MLTFQADAKTEKFVFDFLFGKGKKHHNNTTLLTFAKKKLNEPYPNQETIHSLIADYNKHWDSIKQNYLDLVSNFYGYKCLEPEISVYLSRLPRHPYDFSGDTPWFGAPLSFDSKKTMHVICHELLHYFQPSQLPYLIKESIPVILNHPSFKLETSDAGLNDPETN